MENLVVETDGRIVIPAEVTNKFWIRPGESVSLIPTSKGLLVHFTSAEAWAWAEKWWNGLSDEDKKEARKEAEWYESLSEEERDAIWNEGDEDLERWFAEEDDEDDEDKDEGEEVGLPVSQHSD